jgi:hypothetical protein
MNHDFSFAYLTSISCGERGKEITYNDNNKLTWQIANFARLCVIGVDVCTVIASPVAAVAHNVVTHVIIVAVCAKKERGKGRD